MYINYLPIIPFYTSLYIDESYYHALLKYCPTVQQFSSYFEILSSHYKVQTYKYRVHNMSSPFSSLVERFLPLKYFFHSYYFLPHILKNQVFHYSDYFLPTTYLKSAQIFFRNMYHLVYRRINIFSHKILIYRFMYKLYIVFCIIKQMLYGEFQNTYSLSSKL